MLHQGPIAARSRQAIVTRQRFSFAGALVFAGLLPFALRVLVLPDPAYFQTTVNALVANLLAVVLATWIRLSVQTFPGTRSGTLIAPSIIVAHATVVTLLLMTRLPYDRLGLFVGFAAHLIWVTGLYIAVHRRVRRRFAIVPCGGVDPAGDGARRGHQRREVGPPIGIDRGRDGDDIDVGASAAGRVGG